jgi:cold shock CspA family protein/ribosome-associated translation inhibitor RaiA
MPIPLQITFRNMPLSPAVRTTIQKHAEKLALLHDRVMSCRVVVRAPHRHHRKGKLYHVSIDAKVPGSEIAVNRDPGDHHAHQDVYVAVRDAFNALARRLEDVARRRRGDTKTHEPEPHGRVVRLFPDHGFITDSAGDEVYFHANSVEDDGFNRLHIDDEVRYNPESGEKGLQATVVKPAGKHHMVP